MFPVIMHRVSRSAGVFPGLFSDDEGFPVSPFVAGKQQKIGSRSDSPSPGSFRHPLKIHRCPRFTDDIGLPDECSREGPDGDMNGLFQYTVGWREPYPQPVITPFTDDGGVYFKTGSYRSPYYYRTL